MQTQDSLEEGLLQIETWESKNHNVRQTPRVLGCTFYSSHVRKVCRDFISPNIMFFTNMITFQPKVKITCQILQKKKNPEQFLLSTRPMKERMF